MDIKLPMPMPWTIIGEININKNEKIQVPFQYLADPYNITIPYKKKEHNFIINRNHTNINKDNTVETIKVSSHECCKLLLNWFENKLWPIFQKECNSIKKQDAFGMWVCTAIPNTYNKNYPKKTQWNKDLWCKIIHE
tara:strand:- start:87 stop:497 length:411 start_codon:yes stop_codon:yes gene_type:complete